MKKLVLLLIILLIALPTVSEAKKHKKLKKQRSRHTKQVKVKSTPIPRNRELETYRPPKEKVLQQPDLNQLENKPQTDVQSTGSGFNK